MEQNPIITMRIVNYTRFKNDVIVDNERLQEEKEILNKNNLAKIKELRTEINELEEEIKKEIKLETYTEQDYQNWVDKCIKNAKEKGWKYKIDTETYLEQKN